MIFRWVWFIFLWVLFVILKRFFTFSIFNFLWKILRLIFEVIITWVFLFPFVLNNFFDFVFFDWLLLRIVLFLLHEVVLNVWFAGSQWFSDSYGLRLGWWGQFCCMFHYIGMLDLVFLLKILWSLLWFTLFRILNMNNIFLLFLLQSMLSLNLLLIFQDKSIVCKICTIWFHFNNLKTLRLFNKLWFLKI